VVVVAIVVVVVDVAVVDVDELEDELGVCAVASLVVVVVLLVSPPQATTTNMTMAATTRTCLDTIPPLVDVGRVYPESCPFLRFWGQLQPLTRSPRTRRQNLGPGFFVAGPGFEPATFGS
jgi:hypothetical protein